MRLYLLTLLFLFVYHAYGQDKSKTYLFVGSYTNGEVAEGICVYEFNSIDGRLQEVYKESNLINSSFLTISPNGRYLYACTDSKLEKDGSVSAFKIDSLSGSLTYLNKQSVGGRNPVHVTMDKNSEFLVNSSYTDAGISIFKCNADGSLQAYTQLIEFSGSSIIPKRQAESHIHSSHFDPDNALIFAPDLGADKIRVLSFKRGLLKEVDSLTIASNAGSGPRHFTFHPNKAFAYCVEELSGTLTSYSYKKGKLRWIDSDFSYEREHDSYGSADIHISPDGRFLYASNRGNMENSISIFAIEQEKGTLSIVGHQSTYGNHPRSFVIDPSGNFLLVANQNTGQIVVFKRDIQTGFLNKTNTEIDIPLPSSLKMRKYGE